MKMGLTMPLTLYYGTEIRKKFARNLLYRVACGILFCCYIFSSQSDLVAQKRDKLRFERYTIEQGLSSDRVFDITQDHLGYIWIATESGVSRYDGYGFKVYRNIPGDRTTLSDNTANVIRTDQHGKIWIGTNSGLNLYNPVEDSFRRIYHIPGDESSLLGNLVSEIFESRTGDLWIGTNNGLSQYDPQTESFISQWQHNGNEVDLKGVDVVSITQSADGTLWIGSSNSGLISFDPSTNNIRFFDLEPIPGVQFPSQMISKVYADAVGNVWIGFLSTNQRELNSRIFYDNGGLGRLSLETNVFTLFKYDPVTQPEFWNRISDIIETTDGTLWVTTNLFADFSGLHRFDKQTEEFFKYAHDPLDPSSLIWSYATAVFEDRFNNLWVGTSRGLNKVDLGKWQMPIFRFKPGYPDILIDNYYGIEEVADGIFWLGLDGPGFVEWNRKTGAVTHYSEENPYLQGSDMEIFLSNLPIYKRDPNGEVWVASFETGLTRVNIQTKQIVRHVANEADPSAISGNSVTGLLLDQTNTLWISTTNGLNRYNREDATFTSWTTKNSAIGSNSLSAIFQDSRGIIWLGTSQHRYENKSTSADGLIRFDPNSEIFTTFYHDPDDPNSIGNNTVTTIAEDTSGNLWIGTYNGLNRLDIERKRFQRFLVQDGLPDPVILGLLFDDMGMLWISTMKGLSRFDPITKTFRNFDISDGVQGNRFNDFSYYKARNGELIFGGVAGANYFHPSDIVENAKAPTVILTKMLVNNSPFALSDPVYETGNIELDWSQNSVGFEFTAISFRSPELTVYEYKLEGYDSEWISSGTRRFANYTNLPPNDYVFSVRAVNADGVMSTDIASVSIRIKPPLWRTWWAYGFYAIMLAGMVFGVDRTQRRRLIQKERERTRELELAQAKEIEQAYNNLEVAHESLKSAQTQLIQQEKLASLGQLTAGIAHEIKNPLNFVNNFSNVSLEMIDELKQDVDSYLLSGFSEDSQRTPVNRELKSRIDESIDDIKINLQKIHEHGSRADGIVKSMLQHSRGGSGKMEPTDLNALVSEFVNLSYHGMRAGNNPIDAEITLDLDENIGEVPLVYEDFSRVILNICTNAFDAMRGAVIGYQLSVNSDQGSSTTPKVTGGTVIPEESGHPRHEGRGTGGGTAHLTVRTRREGDRITIEIEDNGPGIPDEIKDKILQPFFTTKKGTQGTGLGLSITHDIIKAHGGRLDIFSSPGEKTTFIIHLKKSA